MGDRTQVNLTVPLEHEAFVRDLFKGEYSTARRGRPLFEIEILEVNGGALDNLHILEEAGIAYNSVWHDGGDFKAGGEYLRFNEEGENFTKTIEEAEENTVQLSEIAKAAEIGIEAVRQIVARRTEYLSVLPWDNQVEYGKRYLARKLINPE